MPHKISPSNAMPRPLFDTLEHTCELYKRNQIENSSITIKNWLDICLVGTTTALPSNARNEYVHALRFLYNYRGSLDTFNSYRREIDRLMQWSWFVQQKSILELKNLDIEEFVEFCQKPPKRWISLKTVSRFICEDGIRIPNPEWRPFVVKVSKKAFQDGKKPNKASFEKSQQGIKQLFAILGSFYNALIQEEIISSNPVMQIRQKSKFIRTQSTTPMIRRLSEQQWQMVLTITKQLAEGNPKKHKRTLFMLQMLYSMYLRISELASTPRWNPKMADFFRDNNDDWWFRTVGKGNKMRQIAVSLEMLEALKEYRVYLGYSPLPSPSDQAPLVQKERGQGGIESTRVIRQLIQTCFDAAVEQLQEKNEHEEAEMLRSATVHWLRHTGISDDIKHRPREHVRDDAGHSSSAITDRYIDVELKERARSARSKTWGK
ncbi:MAG: site-specific integrase [Pseudomonadota bacterium]